MCGALNICSPSIVQETGSTGEDTFLADVLAEGGAEAADVEEDLAALKAGRRGKKKYDWGFYRSPQRGRPAPPRLTPPSRHEF